MSKCHVCGGTKEFEGLCLEDDNMSELQACPFKKCDWYDRDLECTLYYKRDYENCTVKKLESKLKAAEDLLRELKDTMRNLIAVCHGSGNIVQARIALDAAEALLEGKE